MDLSSVEDSATVKAAAGLVLALICLGLCFRFVLHRSVGAIDKSVTGGFVVIEHVDDIVDDLDQLRINQRAFISTGGESFSDGVAENISGIIADMNALEQLRLNDQLMQRQIGQVSRSVDRVFTSVGRANQLQQLFGTEAALALFDDDGDRCILSAKIDAMLLKRLATQQVLHRMTLQRRMRALLDVLF
jgi:CHASE3 domain sensor protein